MKITINDFSDLNNLPVDWKILVVNAQALVDETQSKMKDSSLHMDMTSKALLKSNCKEIEKYIKLISKGKADEKIMNNLELATTKLSTNLTGIVQFFGRQ